ncbi:MAG: alanyl-tRNA editing protein [Streptosporangiaceae bacterium]
MEDTQWRTHRLELDDQTLREWDAEVLAADANGIVLDRSAFYPGGGGQPPDHGVLLWGGVQTRIVDARKGDDLYLVPADGDPLPTPGTSVRGALEDERRTALMRTHSGLHVLCGVVFRDFGALVTGGNMEPLSARMDFNLPDVPAGFREAVEAACNAEVAAGRRIDVRVLPRDEAFALPDIIRTATNLVPPEVRRTAARTWPRPARSAGSRSSRSRVRARASAACASASPAEPVAVSRCFAGRLRRR